MLFYEECVKIEEKLYKSWNDVEDQLIQASFCEKELNKLRDLDTNINSLFKTYCHHAVEYPI